MASATWFSLLIIFNCLNPIYSSLPIAKHVRKQEFCSHCDRLLRERKEKDGERNNDSVNFVGRRNRWSFHWSRLSRRSRWVSIANQNYTERKARPYCRKLFPDRSRIKPRLRGARARPRLRNEIPAEGNRYFCFTKIRTAHKGITYTAVIITWLPSRGMFSSEQDVAHRFATTGFCLESYLETIFSNRTVYTDI